MKKGEIPGNWEIDGTRLTLYNVKKGVNGMGKNFMDKQKYLFCAHNNWTKKGNVY